MDLLASADAANTKAELESLKKLIGSCKPVFVRVPSGVDGFNKTYMVIGREIGAEEVEMPSECGNFQIYTETVGKDTRVKVGPGQVGDVFIAAEDMGTVASLSGQMIFIVVTLNGTDGTYTAEVQNGGTFPDATDTEKAIYLGSISDEGGITQGACGPFSVTVCRNWYAGASPYYGITVS